MAVLVVATVSPILTVNGSAQYACCGGGGGGGGGGGSAYDIAGQVSTVSGGKVINVANQPVYISYTTSSGSINHWCTTTTSTGIFSTPVSPDNGYNMYGDLAYKNGVTYSVMAFVDPPLGYEQWCNANGFNVPELSLDNQPYWSVIFYGTGANYWTMLIEDPVGQSPIDVPIGTMWNNGQGGTAEVGGSSEQSMSVSGSVSASLSVAGGPTGSVTYSSSTANSQTFQSSYSCSAPCGVTTYAIDKSVGQITVYSEQPYSEYPDLVEPNWVYVHEIPGSFFPYNFTSGSPGPDPYSPSNLPSGYWVGSSSSYPEGTSWQAIPHYPANFYSSSETTSSISWGYSGGSSFSAYGVDFGIDASFSFTTETSQGSYYHALMPWYQDPTYNDASCLLYKVFQQTSVINGQVVNGPVHVWVTGTC